MEEVGAAPEPRIYVIYYRHDDPEKNTASKMLRKGLAWRVRRAPPGSIVLDPFRSRGAEPG